MLSSDRIMQYFKNSICIKDPLHRTLKFAISALQKLIVIQKLPVLQIILSTPRNSCVIEYQMFEEW